MTEKVKGAIGNYRWTILALVFFATTVNYLDRQVISLLKDDYLEPLFGWTESDYANIVIVFQLSYAIGMLGAGWVIDKIGTKLGYAFSLMVWSIAAIGHAFSRSTLGFMFARGVLGVSESGNFPAAIKTVAEWFPKKERAFATGIFNSGANVGAIIAPLTVPLIALYWGWQWAFILTGAAGFLWLIFWLPIYDDPSRHRKVSEAELAYINEDKDSVTDPGTAHNNNLIKKAFSFGGRVSRSTFWSVILLCILGSFILWLFCHSLSNEYRLASYIVFSIPLMWIILAAQVKRWHDLGSPGWLALINLIPGGSIVCLGILGIAKCKTGQNQYGDTPPPTLIAYRQSWAFILGKFLTDPVWWFYLFWLPSFLNKQYGMTKMDFALPIAVVYTMTTIGSIYGGWLSGHLIKQGWEVYQARRFIMLICALCVLPVVSAQTFGQYSHWFAILIIGVAASAHQAWSANLFTTTSDMFPKKTVASVTGIGGMAGGFGSIILARTAGKLLDYYKGLGSIETAYYILFIICGFAYLIAWVIFNVLAPKMKRVEI